MSWQQHGKRFPGAFAIVNVSLIPVQKPPQNQHPHEYYFGRKAKFCINLQFIVNAKGEFIDENASYPDSVRDARIWKASAAYSMFCTGILLVIRWN